MDLSASGSFGRAARVSAMPSPEKPPPLTPKKDKAPVLSSSLPNESALLTDSEDDSDTNETFHDAETIPDGLHAHMPPSLLSPRQRCASGPNLSSMPALVANGTTQTTATTAQSSLFAHTVGGIHLPIRLRHTPAPFFRCPDPPPTAPPHQVGLQYMYFFEHFLII